MIENKCCGNCASFRPNSNKIAENGCRNYGEENKNLKAEIERLNNLCQEQNAEVKRLIETKNRLLYNLKAVCEEKDEENVKAEAYKECIEKVKELIGGWGDLEYHSEAIKAKNDLDNLLKELERKENKACDD